MSVSDKGRITETVAAPAHDPAPVPVWWWVGWLAQLDRVEKRRSHSEIDRRVNEGITKARERWERSRPDRVERLKDRYKHLDEQLAELQRATGIDLAHAGRWQLDRLAVLWKASTNVDLGRLASSLRDTAEKLEATVDS
jgi:hypothetical protein